MSRKILVLIGCVLLLLAFGVWGASGQGGEQQFEQVVITTSATSAVGIGSYVAGEAYAVPAGEDPAASPLQALILPYSIHPNMRLHTIEDFVQPEPAVEGFTFAWSLAVPEGSQAELVQSGPVAVFMADVEGSYGLTLKATDASGAAAETTWTVHAARYIGGGIPGLEAAAIQCNDCHRDQASAWAATGHAAMFIRAINGAVSDQYGPDCISCHTTGFNNRPEAVNGGFDDLAAEAGWTFPAELVAGNWEAMVADFPQVAGMANVQCESCHGPGSLHATGGMAKEDKMIGLGLAYGTCAQCHAEEPYHVTAQQWESSAHANKSAEAFWYPVGEERTACVRCHSGAGFIDWANGVPEEEQRTEYQIVTCAVCHDPHDAKNPTQLRVFDLVTLPDGTKIAHAGPAATCMSCHNSRVDPVAAVEGETFSTPHDSTAAELMANTGGYTWGQTLPNSRHGTVIAGTCTTCHMAASPGLNDGGTPDDLSDDQPLPGHNAIGGHTFAMTSPDGVENIAVCFACHGDVASFAIVAGNDYDGDGVRETDPQEVAGLRQLLQDALVANGVEVLDHYPYFTLPENPSVDLKGAVYNFKFTGDAGSAVHNFKYTVALLQLSYERLTGSPVPGAYILK